jgi:hypothetical protein
MSPTTESATEVVRAVVRTEQLVVGQELRDPNPPCDASSRLARARRQ